MVGITRSKVIYFSLLDASEFMIILIAAVTQLHTHFFGVVF